MSTHSFDTRIAKLYGIESATILQNIYFWVEKNKANETHFYDGYYWTYNSVKAFGYLFDYMSESVIRRSLKTLEDNGIIIKGNYNQVKYDRTSWYAITEKGYSLFDKSICQNKQMEVSKITNRIVENNEPIPDIKPVINTNINTYIPVLEKEVVETVTVENTLFPDIPVKQVKEKKQDEKKTKNKHGVHFRVILDGYEYEAMTKEIGEEKTKKLIERADNWLFNNSIKNVKNHYRMMMKWYEKEKQEEEGKRIKDIPVSYNGYQEIEAQRKKQEEESKDVELDFSSLKQMFDKDKGVNK